MRAAARPPSPGRPARQPVRAGHRAAAPVPPALAGALPAATDDAFAKALDQAQADITHQAARKLANLLNEGVDGLGTLLKTANLPPMERLRIIQTILQAFPKLHETITLEDRLDRLEKELEQ